MSKFNPKKMDEEDIENWIEAGLFAIKEMELQPDGYEKAKNFLYDIVGILDSQ